MIILTLYSYVIWLHNLSRWSFLIKYTTIIEHVMWLCTQNVTDVWMIKYKLEIQERLREDSQIPGTKSDTVSFDSQIQNH